MAFIVLRLDAWSYSPGTRQAPHAHDELQLSLVLHGGLVEHVGRRTETAGALSVVLKDPCVTHANEFGACGALMARLSVPQVGVADLVEHPERAAAWRWTHDASVAAPFLRLIARAANGDMAFAAGDDDLADLVAAVSARPAHSAGEPPAWLRDAVARICHGWSPALTVREVARGAGVHPVYLARCVRRWYGVAAGDLLRRSRLCHAADTIAAANRTVSNVAHALGFADEPHLCRQFARATGVSPGRFRRLARAVDRMRPRTTAPREGSRFRGFNS